MARVLVVDDSSSVRQMMSMALKSRQHQVTEAEDGGKAIAVLGTAEFDLIVLDINMPVMNGLEALAALRQQGNLTPVVIVTTEGEETSVERAMKLGASDYVRKPFKPMELLRRLETLLRK